ncbi:excalibur calcium-binding domain-containing protein [Sphingomonas sp.]|nr:excalibur calcium-binding domain-containing protein [Sphingomonas sp.]
MISFANCGEVRAAGKAPLLAGRPGYRHELDPDGTGLACMP